MLNFANDEHIGSFFGPHLFEFNAEIDDILTAYPMTNDWSVSTYGANEREFLII